MASKKVATSGNVSNLPANVQKQMEEEAKAQAGMTEFTGSNFIKPQHGGFKFPDGEVEDEPMQVAVLAIISRNVWYGDQKYIKGQPNPALCAAQGFAGNDALKPMDDLLERQSNDCKTCPMNEWESDPKGGKGKWCQNRKILAVLGPEADESSDIHLVDVSPVGKSHVDTFVNRVTSQNQPTVGVLVDMVTIPAGSSVSISLIDEVENDNAVVMVPRLQEAKTMLASSLPNIGKEKDDTPAKNTRGTTRKKAPVRKKAVAKKKATRRR